jgi:hypothetical protein
MKVKIIPKSQRAKNRVREHGEEMDLLDDQGEKFLVESLDHDYCCGQSWKGWFVKDSEATYEVVK